MKILAILTIILIIGAVIVGPQIFYKVDETQLAIVTRFGQPVRPAVEGEPLIEPGLHVKSPFIETVTYFDRRLLVFDAPPDSLLTKDKKRLIVDVYARGKIVDPLRFFRTMRTEDQARSRAIDIISSELRREVASNNQADIITIAREQVMENVLIASAPKLLEFGIEIMDVRVKRADFPEEIAESVYARMQAERKRKADRERAQGAEADAEIRADVDKLSTIILAEAERDAQILRGEGEAEAARIFAEALGQDPEFYSFQRKLETYTKILSDNTTLVLPTDSDLFRFLQGAGLDY